MATIEQLLHRRSDLSTFLVHFTRESGPSSSYANLLNILSTWQIRARTVFGMATELAERRPEIADSQRVVCFTETPLEHAWMMCSEIEGRAVGFDGYGVAFTKTYARQKGANPVWYLDITPATRAQDWLTVAVQRLVSQAEATAPGESLRDAEILKLTPFIEQMGTVNVRKEFWWEREWRYVGDFPCPPHTIVVAFAPESIHDRLRADLQSAAPDVDHPRFPPRLLDATWGLERMIGELSGASNLGPFP